MCVFSVLSIIFTLGVTCFKLTVDHNSPRIFLMFTVNLHWRVPLATDSLCDCSQREGEKNTTNGAFRYKYPPLALEMRCFRKLLGISYRDHITNEEVKARIGNAIGPYEDLLTTVKRRKLKWYGHVTRSSGLAKTILQGTVQGGRRRGRQRKRWEDNIKEWTGLPWNITLRKAENREEWRKLVVKSTVVPQRSARLRDR